MFYFHIWYRNLQNFSLTRENKQWKHENVENEQCFWYQIFFDFWSFWRLWSFAFRATEKVLHEFDPHVVCI